jgi:hypothetical protein
MKGLDVVKEFVGALESRDLEKGASLLSVDFAFAGLTPVPISRDDCLEIIRRLQSAFGDGRLTVRDPRERGGVIEATVDVAGTHTGDLVLPVPDLPAVPATGKRVFLSGSTVQLKVRGSKIASLRVVVTPGGGFQGLYRQLGAKLPLPSAIVG